MHRCGWASTPLLVDYHDREWGVPLHDDRRLFEFLVLEGAQAGLSWETVLKKREAYRAAFDNFDVAVVATYGQNKVGALLADPKIIRNRLKIEASIHNAKAFLALQKHFVSFDQYIWRFVDGRPKQNHWRSPKDIPAQTPASATLSKDMRQRGFKFVGPTICYAFMQAVGMVNDHLVGCYRHSELAARGSEKPHD